MVRKDSGCNGVRVTEVRGKRDPVLGVRNYTIINVSSHTAALCPIRNLKYGGNKQTNKEDLRKLKENKGEKEYSNKEDVV